MNLTTRAVVIKTQDYRENDKLVWLFTEKVGKVTAIARGAKRNKSKFLSLTLPFCYSEMFLYRGKNLYTINEGQIIESFQDLLGNLESITYASYLCELVYIAMQEEESNRELFKDFVAAFYFMKNNALDFELLSRTFELRILKSTGFGLNLNNCCICKKRINSSDYVSLKYYGGVCPDCERINGVKISYSAYNILKFLNNVPMDKIGRVNASQKDKNEIYRVLSEIISQCYERKPKSLETLKYIKGSENNE